MHLILYSPKTGPRLSYMAHWLGQYLFNEPLAIISDAAQLPAQAFLLNYSGENLPLPAFQIIPHGLLLRQGIEPVETTVENTPDGPLLFPNNGPLGFDLPAAVFYLISRYEEYLPHELDEYGRYAHVNSIAFKNNFLHLPMVDEWMVLLKAALLNAQPELVFAERSFVYTPTYDVDMAWSYAHKGFWRNAAGFLKQLLTGKISAAVERVNVALNGIRDPFDVFDALEGLHQKFRLQPVWFFLLGRRLNRYDKNISPQKTAYRSLIKKLAVHQTGLHPSWRAAHSRKKLVWELEQLEKISGKKINITRYHYVKFAMPDGYEALNGFQQDYSMGYGSINGFRASTCTPYFWYNLHRESPTDLMLFPFAYMDANSIFEQKDSPEKALLEMQRLHDAVGKVQGRLITIFHNHLMGYDPEGRNWRDMYEIFLIRNFSPNRGRPAVNQKPA